MIHDKSLIEHRFSKTLHRYHTMAVVQRTIAERLAEVIPPLNPKSIVELGSGSGFLTEKLVARFPAAHYIANDITAKSREFMPRHVEFHASDGETMPLPRGTELIASASTVQWFDDLPLFIQRACDALPDKGVLAISTFGKENFCEIATQLEYYSIQELKTIARQCGLTTLHSEEWIQTMTFETPLEVLRHINATGVNAITTVRWTQSQLQKFLTEYPTPATLTFHPIILILCKHTS